MVRKYKRGDHLAIGQIFHDAVHQLASADYSEPRLHAWAGGPIDFERWKERCENKQPFVNEIDGEVAGFIELDPDGHIDCTYVAPAHARTGAMSELMAVIKADATARDLPRLYAEVSITARPFFERHGFVILRENLVEIRGETLLNFIMECRL